MCAQSRPGFMLFIRKKERKHLAQDNVRQTTVEGIGRGQQPAVDGQSLSDMKCRCSNFYIVLLKKENSKEEKKKKKKKRPTRNKGK